MENLNLKCEDFSTIKYCKRCHRKLKDEKSKQLGYGKICYKKSIKQESLFLFEMEDIK